LIAAGLTMIERRNAFEAFRDWAADLFEAHIGTAWCTGTGSRMSHRNLTAAVIDSRDFLDAKQRAEIEPDADRRQDRLPRRRRLQRPPSDLGRARPALGKHPEVILMHGGATKGAEFIASRWADGRKVTQMICRPDWALEGGAL
jgi:hypothetical protein